MQNELILRDYQEPIIPELHNGFSAGHKSQVLYLPTGGGKCLGKDTPVLMADGSIKLVQDVIAGDKLMGPDGNIRNVISTTKGYEPLFKVAPKKGDSYVVNESHILSLRKTPGSDTINLFDGSRIDKDSDIVNVNVETFFYSNKTARHCLKGWRSESIDKFYRDDQEIYTPIPAYILGAWLGDGKSDAPVLFKPYCNMVKAWIDYGASINLQCRDESQEFKCSAWRLTNGCDGLSFNLFSSHIAGLNLLKNKHIPYQYKTADLRSRLNLIAGMLDSDGSVSKSGYDWISKSKELADDFVFVCRSVGLSAYASECIKGIKSLDFTGTYWRVSVSGDCDLIPCLDKKSPARLQKKRHLVHGIKIEPVGIGEYFGFEIDGDKLFLLGDFTVTHNTEIAIAMLKAAADRGHRSAMVLDRRVLCDQTSQRLERYEIDHGVMMAGHWRYHTYKSIQICSAQTLEKRGSFPGLKLLIVDECHNTREQTREFIKNNPDVFVVGLSASPFTKGLGKVYSNVVNGPTTKQLVDKGMLAPLRVFIAKEIDMSGAKKVAGEWSQSEATERGIKITGDIVNEWIKKTHEIFGEPKKTIVFCAGVAHGLDLSEKFKQAGYNFVSISYKDDDEAKKEALIEFSKPDSTIHGLIATDILTKGFDQADVMIGVSARPFTKSFSSHVQQLGRVMRPHGDKSDAIWLDHSGNFLRFMDDWEELYNEGVKTLDDGKEKPKPEPTEKEKEAAKCSNCGQIWGPLDVCQHCGHVRPRKNTVLAVPGELQEIRIGKSKQKAATNAKELYAMCCAYAREHSAPDKQKGRAAYIYKDIMGEFPPKDFVFEKTRSELISNPVLNQIKRRNIAFNRAAR